jgi:imidazolonepropionase-like amidohydrolase
MICGALVILYLVTMNLGSAFAATKQLTWIKTTRLLDVRMGKVLVDQTILVDGNKIVGIASPSDLGQPATDTVRMIDLEVLTVLPGLIDCHAHVLGNLKDLSPAAPLRMSSPQGVLWGVRNLQVWLNHGFTTLRDAGESDLAYGQLALRNSIRMSLNEGPRMVSAGNFISVTGGHGDADVLAPDQALVRRPNLADSVDDISAAVRHDINYGADWIKLMVTGGISDPMSDFNIQELSKAK